MLTHHVRSILASHRLLVVLAAGQLLLGLVAGPVAGSSGGGDFPVR